MIDFTRYTKILNPESIELDWSLEPFKDPRFGDIFVLKLECAGILGRSKRIMKITKEDASNEEKLWEAKMRLLKNNG